MNLQAFTDELCQLGAGRVLVKSAMTMAEARDLVRRIEDNEFEGMPPSKARLKKGYEAHEIVSGLRQPDGVKLAGIPPITGLQMGAIGAGSGLAGLGLQKLKHTMTGDPYDEPIDTASVATLRGALGGLTVAGALKLLAKASGR